MQLGSPVLTVCPVSTSMTVQAGGQRYSPSQIGAFVLTKMKETAGGWQSIEGFVACMSGRSCISYLRQSLCGLL